MKQVLEKLDVKLNLLRTSDKNKSKTNVVILSERREILELDWENPDYNLLNQKFVDLLYYIDSVTYCRLIPKILMAIWEMKTYTLDSHFVEQFLLFPARKEFHEDDPLLSALKLEDIEKILKIVAVLLSDDGPLDDHWRLNFYEILSSFDGQLKSQMKSQMTSLS